MSEGTKSESTESTASLSTSPPQSMATTPARQRSKNRRRRPGRRRKQLSSPLARPQLVDDAFSKVNLRGNIKSTKSTVMDLYHDLTYIDIRHLRITSVAAFLERLKDVKDSGRLKLAMQCADSLHKYLDQDLSSWTSNAQQQQQNENDDSSSGPSPNQQVFLEARVVLASEGNCTSRAITGCLGHGHAKLVITWCMYSLGSGRGCRLLRFGRNALADSMLSQSKFMGKVATCAYVAEQMVKELACEIVQEIKAYANLYHTRESSMYTASTTESALSPTFAAVTKFDKSIRKRSI